MTEDILGKEPTIESFHDDGKRRRRQRMSVVCLNCKARKIKCDKKKPVCSNCDKSNVGHLCHYESPHWLQRVKSADKITVSFDESTNSSRSASSDNTAMIEELQREVQRLKSLLNNKTFPEASNSSVEEFDFMDTIDFYASYKALSVKRSGMEEHKPLSCCSHEFKDQYSMVMISHSNLGSAFCLSKLSNDVMRDKRNKKQRLDGSLTASLLLLGEFDIPDVQQVATKFVKARLSVTDRVSNKAPGFESGVGLKEIANSLKEKIEKDLPTAPIIKLYLKRFHQYIYPHFPFLQQEFFDARVFNTVLIVDKDTQTVSLNLVEKFDWILVATLMIILRLTFVVLPELEHIAEEFKILVENPIDSVLITHTLTLLSSFKLVRKTKLTIIQCLIFLRLYYCFAPEDGDGAELAQSQILFGVIVQSAYTIGLNRDASCHPQMTHDKEFSNLWRRVWWGIIAQDRSLSPMAGYNSLIPSDDTFNVKIPIVADDPSDIESTISQEFDKSQRILKLYSSLTVLVNSVSRPPRVSDILSILKQMESYFNVTYSLNSLEKLSEYPSLNVCINLRNTKRIQHSLQTLSLKLTIYQDLWLHYESKFHNDTKKALHFQLLTIQTTTELVNLIYKYLNSELADKIDQGHMFYLNRFIHNACERVYSSLSSFLSRLYHATDMINRGLASESSRNALDILTSKTFKTAAGMLTLLQNTLGKQYYLVFKSSFRFKFYLRSLKKDGFKCVRDTISFIKHSFLEHPELKEHLIEKLQLRLNPEQMLNELDSLNNVVNLLPNELNHYVSVIDRCEILRNEKYMSDDLIWRHSFKRDENDLKEPDSSGVTPSNTYASSLNKIDELVTQVVPELEMISNGPEDSSDSFPYFNIDQIMNNTSFLDFQLEDQLSTPQTEEEKFDWLFKL